MPNLRYVRKEDLIGATRDELLSISKDIAYAKNNNLYVLLLEENKIEKITNEQLVDYIVSSRSFKV